MADKLTDDEVQALVESMWSQTVDENGAPLEAESAQGQMALELVSKIVGAALILRLKPDSEVIPFPRQNS